MQDCATTYQYSKEINNMTEGERDMACILFHKN
jgi:hypothetical protein